MNNRGREGRIQCGQIGQFFEDLNDSFITKVYQIPNSFMGYLEKHHFLRMVYFVDNFRNKLGCFLIHHLVTLLTVCSNALISNGID